MSGPAHVGPMVVRSHVTRAQRTAGPTFEELGTTGLRHYGGFVVEEWLTKLSGRRGVWVWREMADNDPVIGAFLFAIEMLARSVEWRVEEGGDARAAEHVESCMDDMSGTWPDFISEAFSMLPYGWAFHETVYKRRQGPDADPGSRYDDGLIGWRKIPVRAQETLQNWEFADDGGIQAMVQVAYDGVRREIPIEKALLFRTSTKRNNPEGRSILRNAYVSWFRKKNIEEIEAIGIERDLAGIPTLSPPEGVDLNLPANAQLKQAAQDLVTAVRRDEDEGILFPTAGWEFKLTTTGGSRQIDTDAVIRRYDQRIATTVLADFILLAQDRVGSYALGSVKIDTFGQAMQAWLLSIAEVLNRYAIPRLLRLNGWPVVDPPRIVPGEVGQQDIEKIAQFLQSLSLAGAPIPWSELLMKTLFDLAGLPEPEDVPDITTQQPPALAKDPAPDDAANPDEAIDPTEDQPVAKAADGNALPASAALRPRAALLARTFQREIHTALAGLGDQAAKAYLAMVNKADTTATDAEAATLADRILAALDVKAFARDKLAPLYRRQYQRVIRDVPRTLKASIGLQTSIPDQVARDILAKGGSQLGLLDIAGPARDAIIKAITEGRTGGEYGGENPVAIARRIRELVPAGRFTQAGAPYRSELIARTETMNAMRLSSLAAYRSASTVVAAQLRDGLLATSDDECIGRDGDVVSLDEAEQEAATEHPLGTLSFDPVVA